MEAILFIGIQATGKSSYYKEFFFNSHIRISLDLLNTKNKQNRFLDTCFNTHSQFVIDNTNPDKATRKVFIDKAKENKYKVIGYYFSSEIKESISRNDLREGKEKIPKAGILSCYNKLELPDFSEGFDELYFVKMKKEGFDTSDWKNEI